MTLGITINEEKTEELVKKYAEQLGIKPAQVIALAMRAYDNWMEKANKE